MLQDGVNEKWMFHGVKTLDAAKAIAEHGFDTRVAERGYLGAGIYVAQNSDLANKYVFLLFLLFFPILRPSLINRFISYTQPCDSNRTRYCIYGRFLMGVTEDVPSSSLYLVIFLSLLLLL